MKIIVFSDSHRDVDTMEKAVNAEKPDMVLHLGDHAADGIELELRFEGIPVITVDGNCDFRSMTAGERMLDLEGIRILMTHGHRYDVRNGYSAIITEGLKREANLILCGHTHIPVIIEKDTICLMNPGKAGKFARGQESPSFGIIETENGLHCHIKKVSSVI